MRFAMNMEIDRSWRHWNNDDKSSPEDDTNIPDDNGQLQDTKFNPTNTPTTSNLIQIPEYFQSGGNLGLSEIPNQARVSSVTYLDEAEEMEHKVSFLHKYETMNRHIENYSRNADSTVEAYRLEHLEMRRLNNAVATVFAKIAEDLVGEPQPGDDEWYIPDLLQRKITRKPINKCKVEKERERLLLVLDNSPSCAAEASFYSTIATAALKLNDVDIYAAPNARVNSTMNQKTGKFEKLPAKDMCDIIKLKVDDSSLEAYIGHWKRWKNRVIVFFGDFDGATIICNASRHAKRIYWFCNVEEEYIEDEYAHESYVYLHSKSPFSSGYDKGSEMTVKEAFAGKFYSCMDKDDFMRLVKKIRP